MTEIVNEIIAADRLGTALLVIGPCVILYLTIILGYALCHTDWSKVHEPGILPCDET